MNKIKKLGEKEYIQESEFIFDVMDAVNELIENQNKIIDILEENEYKETPGHIMTCCCKTCISAIKP